jgi:hypothetical protein
MLLDHVAEAISRDCCPTSTSSVQVADLLISHIEMTDARHIPGSVSDFVNEVLRSSYPPEPRNKIMSLWMIRSLTRLIDTCPVAILQSLLEYVQEGLSIWVSDEWQVFSEEEYDRDVCTKSLLPCTQEILMDVT